MAKRRYFSLGSIVIAHNGSSDIYDVIRELRYLSIKRHGDWGYDLISHSGLKKYARANFPKDTAARKEFLNHVYKTQKGLYDER